ncbi:hypothetical protein RF11_14821 [Thelohanellus kitauei]|uniref:Uncharacterized protein n=1 Tax=Thelohanellus kitauei TaxID=669202 RepID=A0A0C2N9W5_THEKT|nr:hypothetical protein RF11_14821 [Thelohanellus kitauei]
MKSTVIKVKVDMRKVKPRCGKNDFECFNKQCIKISKFCDGKDDCGDNSDEEDCVRTKCKHNEWTCNDNKSCIPYAQVCDGNNHCPDSSDEKRCIIRYISGNVLLLNSVNISCIHACDGECLPPEQICDGIKQCKNGSDEINCGPNSCPKAAYVKCQIIDERVCISKMCDGVIDCSDGSDENQFCCNLYCY